MISKVKNFIVLNKKELLYLLVAVVLLSLSLPHVTADMSLSYIGSGETWLNVSIDGWEGYTNVYLNGEEIFNNYQFHYISLVDLEPNTPYTITVFTVDEVPTDASISVTTDVPFFSSWYFIYTLCGIVSLVLSIWFPFFAYVSMFPLFIALVELLEGRYNTWFIIYGGLIFIGAIIRAYAKW